MEAVCEALTNLALDLDYIHLASIAVIMDFNKIFTLQYALAVTRPERFRELAEEYDPEKLHFGHIVCEETKNCAEEMAKIYKDETI